MPLSNLAAERLVEAPLCGRGVARVHGEADRVLRRALRHHLDWHSGVIEHCEDLLRDAAHTDHTRALYVHDGHVLYRREACNNALALDGPLVGLEDAGAAALRVERVTNKDWNVGIDRRKHGLGMNDLGPEVCELHRLRVRELRKNLRFRHSAGVRREHAVHVRPDRDLRRFEELAEDGRAEVAPIALGTACQGEIRGMDVTVGAISVRVRVCPKTHLERRRLAIFG
mmetsp:Transcript_37712/g.102564  ORF Transcript_37712/g.102564 Transcript_37712/m.102564 type:complete len:227 (-) Transcript_37712:762-1442(-)